MNSFKFSSRIVEIIEKIEKKNSIIVDVGCDHCYTSIKALVEKKAKFAYNIDVNEKPLLSGIKNIKKFNLEKKTKNIIANGLDTNEIKKTVNYCIISGMGGKTICEIIQNKNKKIKIKNYILVPNNNEYQLRLLLKKNGWAEKTFFIVEDNVIYQIVCVSLKKKKGYLIPDDEYSLWTGNSVLNKNKEKFVSNLIDKYTKIEKKANLNKYDSFIEMLKQNINR